jgi:hypothetical protein
MRCRSLLRENGSGVLVMDFLLFYSEFIFLEDCVVCRDLFGEIMKKID